MSEVLWAGSVREVLIPEDFLVVWQMSFTSNVCIAMRLANESIQLPTLLVDHRATTLEHFHRIVRQGSIQEYNHAFMQDLALPALATLAVEGNDIWVRLYDTLEPGNDLLALGYEDAETIRDLNELSVILTSKHVNEYYAVYARVIGAG